MKEDQQFSDDPIENEHLQHYIEKKSKRNSRLRVGRKNKRIKKKRHQRLLKTALPLCLFFLLIALISGYFASPFSKVKKVIVVPSQQQKQLKNSLPVSVGDSLIMIKSHEAKINDLVKQNNLNVKSLNINWKKHNEAVVKIKFYDFYGYINKGNQYYLANARGQISNKPSKVKDTTNVVILKGFYKREQVKTCLEQYDKLPAFLKADVKEIKNEASVDDAQKVKLFLKDGNQVILKNNELVKKMAYYPNIKTTLKRPSVVNLEYGAYATPIK